MHALVRLFLMAGLTVLTATAAESTHPFWDGEESIEQYAKRAGLEPTKTIDLGNGVTMEFVLIPAGTFTMGTPEPRVVDGGQFAIQILSCLVVAVSSQLAEEFDVTYDGWGALVQK